MNAFQFFKEILESEMLCLKIDR